MAWATELAGAVRVWRVEGARAWVVEGVCVWRVGVRARTPAVPDTRDLPTAARETPRPLVAAAGVEAARLLRPHPHPQHQHRQHQRQQLQHPL